MTYKTWILILLGSFLWMGCEKDGPDGDEQGLVNDEAPEKKVSKSFFIINEDWYGRQNGTVNRLWLDGHITYRAYRKANPGAELGITAQYGMVYGPNMYVVSKQGERFVVADASTLEKKASFGRIGSLDADGRACVGVDAQTVYVSSQAGIAVFDIPSLTFTGSVGGMEAGQVGDMVCVGSRVFAAMQGKGVLVIDTRSHRVDTVIETSSTGGICISRNGWLWISGKVLKAYDPYSLELQRTVESPSGDGGGVSWGIWRSGSLCASTQRDRIYWLGRHPQSPSGPYPVYKYDILSQQLSTVMDLDTYGSFRIDPLTDAISTPEGKIYNDQGVLQRAFKILGGTPQWDGTVDETEPYPYWFASLPVFEDVNRPEILTRQMVLSLGSTHVMKFSDMVVDYDQISASIHKEVIFEKNSMLQHELRGDALCLKGLAVGATSFVMRVVSNGFSTERRILVEVIP